MPISVPLSAKNCVVRVSNTLVLVAAEWDIDPSTTWEDASSFESQGFEQVVACLSKAEVTISGWYDYSVGGNMFDAPLAVKDGVLLNNVRCYLSGVNSAYWLFPIFAVVSPSMSVRVGSRVNYRVRGRASGVFSYPTGN